MTQKIIFWQNIPSIHQSALIRSLSNDNNYQVSLICERNITPERRALGWQMPNYGRCEIVIAPEKQAIEDFIYAEALTKIHIFAGMRSCPLVKGALHLILRTEAKFGLYSEIPDNPYGLSGFAKRLLYSIDALKLRNRLSFFLAIGNNGSNWYRNCGYSTDIIFPFGYFLEAPNQNPVSTAKILSAKNEFRIVFIGNLIKRKGVDILLTAAAKLQKFIWEIDILGDGIERQALLEMRDSLGLKERVRFLGALENSDAMGVLAAADLLVLPSRHDGWGAVVNEALMRGLPVICSDKCGAATLLSDSYRGEIFEAGNASALKKSLERWIQNGRQEDTEKNNIRAWAMQHISGEAAANYLKRVLFYSKRGGPKPAPPWIKTGFQV